MLLLSFLFQKVNRMKAFRPAYFTSILFDELRQNCLEFKLRMSAECNVALTCSDTSLKLEYMDFCSDI
jgi:hypothetical protein